jgi:hypothetical protein
LAAFLSSFIFEVLARFDPLKSTLSVFFPWERVVVVGIWCALLGVISLIAGRQTAEYRGWRAELCIGLVGVGLGAAHFPSLWHRPPLPLNYPYEYTIGVAEMTICWTVGSLIAHWLMPNISLERTRGR